MAPEDVVLIQLSPKRFAVISLNGLTARGYYAAGDNRMRTGTVLFTGPEMACEGYVYGLTHPRVESPA